MKVKDVMTRDVAVAAPSDSVRSVAKRMAGLDIVALPVCDGERLLGMVSDRDIVVGAVAAGRSLDTAVVEVMNTDADCVFEDDDLEEAIARLDRGDSPRLPVLDHHHRVTGILSLADVGRDDGRDFARRRFDRTAKGVQ